MKRVLFLLMIATYIHADQVADLEKAIMESDLPVVEKLLEQGVSISQKDQLALISLATTVIQNRIDLRNVAEIKGSVQCPETKKKLAHLDQEGEYYMKKSLIYFFLPVATLLAVIPLSFLHVSDNTLDTICVCSVAICWLLSGYNFCKVLASISEFDSACQTCCDELLTASIKIRQLLYKITPNPAYSLNQ